MVVTNNDQNVSTTHDHCGVSFLLPFDVSSSRKLIAPNVGALSPFESVTLDSHEMMGSFEGTLRLVGPRLVSLFPFLRGRFVSDTRLVVVKMIDQLSFCRDVPAFTLCASLHSVTAPEKCYLMGCKTSPELSSIALEHTAHTDSVLVMYPCGKDRTHLSLLEAELS